MVLLAAFDCVDDTKLLSKAIVGEIIGDGKEEDSNIIAEVFGSEKAGRKVLLYLLATLKDNYAFFQFQSLKNHIIISYLIAIDLLT